MATPPKHNPSGTDHSTAKTGLIAGIIAYTLWGFFPIYFKLTEAVSPMEILSHRIFWSVPFGLLIIAFRSQFREVWQALKQPKTVGLLSFGALALALNWGVYIWAIQIDQIFQASLGYYINPLIYVLIGVVFFSEKLSRYQAVAVALAVIGVGVLALYGGTFPYISLVLAVSFTIYGVIRKQVKIGAMPGLLIETLVLLPAAIAYLIWLKHSGSMMFAAPEQNGGSTSLSALLIAAGPITVLPLLAFAIAARKLKLSTLGFLQFIGPTLQFVCGLYYGERFTSAHAICFGFIWAAVALFSWDAYRQRAQQKPKKRQKPKS